MSGFTPSDPTWGLNQNVYEQYPPTIRSVMVLIDFLQWRFSLLPTGCYHWAPEDAESPESPRSEIYIAGDTPLPAKDVGDRPAITVLRSQIGFQGIGLGDVAFHNWQTGGKVYMDLVPTTLVVNVLSRLPFVAERLAWFVHDQIWALREEIVRREKCILSLGARCTISPPSPAGSLVDSAPESDWINVAIFIPTYLQHRVGTVPLNRPVLKGIDMAVREVVKSK